MEFEFQSGDVPMEVLSRMPATSVLRLKCVSKAWLHFTTDASFRRLHFQRSSSPFVSGFFFQERFQWCDDDIESLSYIPVRSTRGGVHYTVLDFLPKKVVLMASSNGLLCCRSCNSSPERVIYICNPACKEYLSVKWTLHKKAESFALAFDAFSNPMDSSTNFKLVSVHLTDADPMDEEAGMDLQISFEIYSSKTGLWRSIEDTCLCNFSSFKNKGVFAGGVLYWLTDVDKVIMFDLENEKSGVLHGPPTMQCKGIPEMCIGESEGNLHYIQISEVGLQDWMLEDSQRKWLLKHSISLCTMAEEYPQFLCNIVMRVASRTTQDLKPYLGPLAYKDGILLMIVRSKIYSYNLYTRKMEELCSLDCLGPNSAGSPSVLPYSLSLLLPLGGP